MILPDEIRRSCRGIDYQLLRLKSPPHTHFFRFLIIHLNPILVDQLYNPIYPANFIY